MDARSVALGLVECRSLAQGAVVTDALLKTASVHLTFSMPVSPGKLLVAVQGGVADVEAALEKGLDVAGSWLEDALFIPQLHPEVASALVAPIPPRRVEALGLVETATVAAAVRAADAALKTAAVELLSVRLGQGIGGKALVVLCGRIADAEAAVEAGRDAVRVEALLVHTAVIPSPHPDYGRYLDLAPQAALDYRAVQPPPRPGEVV